MTKRLIVLLCALVTTGSTTLAYWFWPDFGRPLPEAAVARISGPLYVMRVEPVTDDAIAAMVESLAPHLPIEVRATDEWVLDDRHLLQWDDDLYNSEIIVARLEEITPPGTRVLGVTDQPMFDEGHWWLFGTAQLGGRTGVVSTAHLWVDDIPGDTAHPLFRERLSKVGVHEFGHTLGFVHCEQSRCIMRFSTDVGVLDHKRHTFCRMCLFRDFSPLGRHATDEQWSPAESQREPDPN
jgi:archaemetzincin